MFEELFNPKDKAQAAKGKIKILLLYIPAFAAWAGIFWQFFKMAETRRPFHPGEFALFCLFFAAALELVWLSFEWHLKRVKKLREEVADIPKPRLMEEASFARALPSGQPLPKIPFSDFVPGPNGFDIREERFFETEKEVIQILAGRELTAQNLRLFKSSYPAERYPQINEYLHRRLLVALENEKQARQMQAAKNIENARKGETIHLQIED
jgi:hypothetical protein